MNRIETSHNELYIIGERSGSETITLTCNEPIEVTYEQFTNDLNGIVNVSIVDNFTTEVKFNVSYSDLYLNGETYSGVIHARLTGDVDKLDIPVVINCSDTLIYSDVPNDSVIDVLDGIHINYSSEPDINNVKLILEDGTEKNITYELSNQKIHISYLALLLDFGVIDYDYICASNGLSQISHKLKKVVYEFDLLKEKNIYIDYREQWVEFKFTSKRNGKYIQFTYDSPFDGLEYYWHVDEDSNVVMRVKVPVNYEKERIIPITIKQDESKYIINVNIIQEKGELDFMFKSQNPIYVSDQESTVIVKILSYASGEYPLPIIGGLPSYIQHISTILNEDMVYEVKLKFEKNDLYKRGGTISFEQKDFRAFIYLKYYQDGLEFTPGGGGSSEDDNGNIMKGLLGFWGLGNHIAQGDSGELIQKYSFIRRTINNDGEEELIELIPHRIIIDGTPDIVTWTEYNDDYTLPSYNKAMGIETSLDMNDIKIIPITKDVGQLLFYRSELGHLDSLDLPLIVTDNMFAYSKIKTVGTKETPLDLNNVEEANQMFMGSDTLSIYLNNTHNLKNALGMFDSSGFGENPVNINSENGVNLNLLGAVNIGGLFENSNVYNINELLLSNKCTYISAAFRGCKYLEKIPLIECEGVTSADWLLSSCHNLVDVGGFKDLKCELDLTYCEKISKSSLMNIINYLGDVRYKGGDNLILNSRSLNMLSDDEKMIAVNKGWTIIVDNVIVDIKPISEENECIYIAKESTGNRLYNRGNIMVNDTSVIDAFLNDISYDGYEFDGTVGVRYNYKFKVRGTDYESLFGDCLYRVVKLDTSNAYSVAGLFSGCEDLISVPEIDISNSSAVASMFYNCSSLTTIPQLNTSNVTNMYGMFSGCSSLTSVPLLDTSSVTSMGSMFSGCSSLISVPLLDTSSVTSMDNMFSGCSSLTSVPLLDTSKVTSMVRAFYNCSSLTTIPQLNTSSVTSMDNMFYGCSSLTTIPQLNTSNVTHMSRAFYNCSSLTTIPRIDASKWEYVSNMFYKCTSLTDVGGFVDLGRSGYVSDYIDLHYSTLLTHESLMNIINGLYSVGPGYYRGLRLGEINIAKLTDDEIAIATRRGWEIV